MTKTHFPTIGNDPELFVKKGIHLIPGEALAQTKKFPQYVKIDNAALEIHPGPYQCLQQQNASLASQLFAIKKVLDEDQYISLRTCERIRPIDLKKYPSLTAFGCEPSLVCHPEYGVMASKPEVDPLKVRDRSIGFHVHLGGRTPLAISKERKTLEAYGTTYVNTKAAEYDILAQVANLLHTTEGRARLVQACDLFVGLPAVLIDRDVRQRMRRKILGYGKAGEFREQKHGFEYRTLGPWPLYHPMLAWWANAAVRNALVLVINDVDTEIKKKVNMLDVANAINNNSLIKALPLWNVIKRMTLDSIKLNSDNHPWTEPNIRKFEFLLVKGGLRFLTEQRKLSDSWFTRKKEESENRSWEAYYNGFPNSMELLLKNNTYTEYQEFSKKWSPNSDVLTKYML